MTDDRIQELLDQMQGEDDPHEALRLSKELRAAICAAERETQPITLKQRAHLLSAELGITPKEALDRLQGHE